MIVRILSKQNNSIFYASVKDIDCKAIDTYKIELTFDTKHVTISRTKSKGFPCPSTNTFVLEDSDINIQINPDTKGEIDYFISKLDLLKRGVKTSDSRVKRNMNHSYFTPILFCIALLFASYQVGLETEYVSIPYIVYISILSFMTVTALIRYIIRKSNFTIIFITIFCSVALIISVLGYPIQNMNKELTDVIVNKFGNEQVVTGTMRVSDETISYSPSDKKYYIDLEGPILFPDDTEAELPKELENYAFKYDEKVKVQVNVKILFNYFYTYKIKVVEVINE